jgi:hypothetical protein
MIGLGFGAQLRFPFVCNPLPFFRVWCFLLSTCVRVYTYTAFRNYMVISYILHVTIAIGWLLQNQHEKINIDLKPTITMCP